MTTAPPLDPGKGTRWTTIVRELVHHLEDTAPPGYDGVLVAPYHAQQSSPINPTTGRPYSREALDLIRRPFLFAGGRLVVVELTRLAFVGLLRAMREVPEIEVGFGAGTTASWRSWYVQADLYARHLAGGPLAAPPGHSWHHRCAVDLGDRGEREQGRAAMIAEGFHDLLPQDPPHFNRMLRG